MPGSGPDTRIAVLGSESVVALSVLGAYELLRRLRWSLACTGTLPLA